MVALIAEQRPLLRKLLNRCDEPLAEHKACWTLDAVTSMLLWTCADVSQLSYSRVFCQAAESSFLCAVQGNKTEAREALRKAVAADAGALVTMLTKAEQCAADVLARLGHQSNSMAALLQGEAGSMAARLPEMQASLFKHEPPGYA